MSICRPALMSLIAVVAAIAACGAAPRPSESSTLTQAIVNGTREPTVVELTAGQILANGWLHDLRAPATPFCSGTLVSDDVVVTAGHCLDDVNWDRLGFGLRPNDLVSIPVADIFVHPSVDAAFLRLSEAPAERVPQVEALAINFEPLQQGWIGERVEVTGYGDTRSEGSGQFFAALEMVGFDDTYLVVDGKGERGLCFGDSGGPALRENAAGEVVILGVESYGDESCVDRDRLTRLDPLGPFIAPILDGGAPPVDLGGCGEVTFEGMCEGTRALWCDSGTLREIDCASRGSICTFVGEELGYYCESGCGDVTVEGVCDGDTLVFCRNGTLRERACSSTGRICGFDDAERRHRCLVGEGPEATPRSDVSGCSFAGSSAWGILVLFAGLGLRRKRSQNHTRSPARRHNEDGPRAH